MLLEAGDLDPRFVPMPAGRKCLQDWKASKAASAQQSLVAIVDLSEGDGRYTGLRDTEPVFLASAAKLGVMYPAFQLRLDLRVTCA